MTAWEVPKDWPRTPRGKAICPECGHDGWPYGVWIKKHLVPHDVCECGAKVQAGYLGTHRAHSKAHRTETS